MEILKTIESYQESIEQINGRIQQLTREIQQKGGEGHPKTKALARRRYLLYRQMAELQGALRGLQEYAVNTLGPEPPKGSDSFVFPHRRTIAPTFKTEGRAAKMTAAKPEARHFIQEKEEINQTASQGKNTTPGIFRKKEEKSQEQTKPLQTPASLTDTPDVSNIFTAPKKCPKRCKDNLQEISSRKMPSEKSNNFHGFFPRKYPRIQTLADSFLGDAGDKKVVSKAGEHTEGLLCSGASPTAVQEGYWSVLQRNPRNFSQRYPTSLGEKNEPSTAGEAPYLTPRDTPIC